WLAGESGTLLRGDGKKWRALDVGAATKWLTRVAGRSADDVWAAGWGGVVVHWNGKTWTQLPAIAGHEKADLRALRVGRDVAVAGPDFVARWDGASWHVVADHLDPVRDIVITSDGEVWIATETGILFRQRE
ncbi:MAG TPA: hypothetical protein VIA18_27465, partial [Polyangia bacterium]|nr:hypothetical protein [Polyangia bacterium]